MSRFADIVLPLAQPAYTYAIPDGMEVEAGDAVVVQFGLRKYYTGIVWQVHDRRPAVARVKSIERRLYDRPLLSGAQRSLWEWIATYYICSLGEVMRSALPALMKPSADSEAQLLDRQFHPRTERYYRLAPHYASDEKALNELLDHYERRAPRLYAALLEVVGSEERMRTGEVARRLLRSEITPLNSLVKKEILCVEEHTRDGGHDVARFLLPTLSEHQRQALEALHASFEQGKTAALLHGITGSGKTEIYIHLIAETLARGGDVLLLVPEIALTAQLIERMERIFGSRVTAYHSRLTNLRRAETYLQLNHSQGGEFVVGVRSSIFLPFRNLQLVIVDEEHDASYKQAEPAPRYEARDVAVYMAHAAGGRAVLGSATPSLESWLNARYGKYGFACLSERYGEARPPKIYLSDTRRAARRGERHGHFNKLLLDKMEQTLARGEQVILFQNRRGFAPYLACTECGWTAQCPSCNVTLTYHKGRGALVCHYCGHTEPVVEKCPSCKVVDLQPMGFGTEKIEEQIRQLFPEVQVARLDRDEVTSESAFNRIIGDFAARRTSILIGTQMVTKGFDFEGVALVGVLNADNLLHNPDFRATERAFQQLTQVAGRAGRRASDGEVVIQTAEPQHPILQQVLYGDFEMMSQTLLREREDFNYPPYTRLTQLTLRHTDPDLLRRCVGELAQQLRARFGRRLMGPVAPPVDRIRGEYIRSLLLKIEQSASRQRAHELLREQLKRIAEHPDYKSVTISINVDPQ